VKGSFMENTDTDVEIHMDESYEPLISHDSEVLEKPRTRKLSFYFLISAVVLAVILPVSFLVILPAVVRNECEHTDISIVTTTLTNPTNEAFESDVVMKFSKNAILPSTSHIQEAQISWDGSGGGHLVRLKHSSTIHVTSSPHHLRSHGVVDNVTAFTDFNKYIIEVDSFDWRMKGNAIIHVMGTDVKVHIDKVVPMYGYNNFDVNPVISNVVATAGAPTTLFAIATALLNSESNIVLNFGQNLNFHMISNGVPIGIGTIPNCSMLTGNFSVHNNITMSYTNDDEYVELMYVVGNYISGIPTPISLEGFFLDHPVQWLEPALQSMTMASVLPGVDRLLVDRIDMYVSIGNIVNVPFDLHMYNPLELEILVTALYCNVYLEGIHIATVDESVLMLSLPPNEVIITPTFSARVDLKHSGSVVDLLSAGFGLLDLDCQIVGTVDEFSADLHYVQANVSSYIHSS